MSSQPVAQRTVSRKDDLERQSGRSRCERGDHAHQRDFRSAELIGHAQAGDSHRSRTLARDEQHVV